MYAHTGTGRGGGAGGFRLGRRGRVRCVRARAGLGRTRGEGVGERREGSGWAGWARGGLWGLGCFLYSFPFLISNLD